MTSNDRGAKYDIDLSYVQGVAIGDNAQVHIHAASLPPSREELLDVVHQAGAELRAYPNQIAGEHINRPEVDQIVEWVLNATPEERLGMLIDQPGGGKTVVMQEVLVRLGERGFPVLPIKGDTLSGVKNRSDLADRLGLPALVEDCARVLTGEGLFVVLLDQLDALSLSPSRDQATLDVLLSTLARLRDFENVRLVASCRTFELNNDARLSGIKIDKRFHLRPLSEAEVDRILQVIGVESTPLLREHRNLLAVPQHLKIYVQVVTNRKSPILESFHTLQDLYEILWQDVIAKPLPDDPPPQQRIAAIYRLVDAMSERKQLTAPVAVLDEYADVADYLQGEAFIRRENGNWLFTHQTLLDYYYARRFVAQGQSLSQEILSGPQGLFERSQLVQVLAYLRGTDWITYHRELRSLFFAQDLRIHLRLLLLGWFGALPDPTVEEFKIAKWLLQDPDHCGRFLLATGGNIGWFEFLGETVLPRLLKSDDEQLLNAVISLMGTMVQMRTQAVLAHLRPYLGRNESWDARIAWCLSRLEVWQNEEALEVLIDLLRRGRAAGYAMFCLHNLAKSNPVAGCRVIQVYLELRLDALLSEERAKRSAIENDSVRVCRDALSGRFTWNRELFGEYAVGEVINVASHTVPEAIIEYLLPWFIHAVTILTEPYEREDAYPSDSLFSWGWYEEHPTEGANFARRMAEALGRFAKTNPLEFRTIAPKLITLESLAIQRVLAWGYLSDPKLYADDIFEYLSTDSRRLDMGESLSDPRYDSRRLYSAAFRYVDDTRRVSLERMILDLWPTWEHPQLRGITQLGFLKSISPDMLSITARDRLGELERKFPDFEPSTPRGIGTFVEVGAPIGESAQSKMSDDAWLAAMRKYDESTGRGMPHEEVLTGGVVELSRSFAERVKEDPERFHTLVLRFDETIALNYVEAAISGLADSDASAERVFDLVRRFASHIEGGFRVGVCRALMTCAKKAEVPVDLLDLMQDWALNDPDPDDDVWPIISESDIANSVQRNLNDPLTRAINSVRGVATRAVCTGALSHTLPKVERVFSLLEQAARDKSTAVRAGVIERLGPLLQKDIPRCLDIFETALDGHPRLLQTAWIHRFLYWVYRDHFRRIRPFLENMLRGPDEPTRQAGASLVCLARFQYSEAQELVDQIMQGDAAVRRGAARVYARNLGAPEVQPICEAALRALKTDPDPQVRSYIGECFGYLEPENLEGLRSFIEQFIHSPALIDGARHLLEYLAPLAADVPDLALMAVNRVLDEIGSEVVDIRTSAALVEPELARLSLAVYTHAEGLATKSEAMTTFERMLLIGSQTAHKALQDWDRQ